MTKHNSSKNNCRYTWRDGACRLNWNVSKNDAAKLPNCNVDERNNKPRTKAWCEADRNSHCNWQPGGCYSGLGRK